VTSTLVDSGALVGFVTRDLTQAPLTDTLLSIFGRAYPDISAQGTHFQIVAAGEVKGVGGTSASAPVCFPATTAGSSSPWA
jgi:hypothetical protein